MDSGSQWERGIPTTCPMSARRFAGPRPRHATARRRRLLLPRARANRVAATTNRSRQRRVQSTWTTVSSAFRIRAPEKRAAGTCPSPHKALVRCLVPGNIIITKKGEHPSGRPTTLEFISPTLLPSQSLTTLFSFSIYFIKPASTRIKRAPYFLHLRHPPATRSPLRVYPSLL